MSSSHSHGCTCAEDRLKEMAPVLDSINVNAIPAYASRIRQQHQYANCHECSSDTIDCAVLLPPLCGSYHVLFQLEFTDGLRWIIKFPATGYRGRYDAMSARALKSEALTMRLLKRDTTIPIPEVYSFDATIDNELNCPHILMEFIRGIKVSEGWFNSSSPLVSIEQFRTNVLKDVAGAIVQLNNFVYNQSGSLIFDDDGNVTGTGPAKVVDGPAWAQSVREDQSIDSAFFENGPFDDPRSCFLSALERHAGPNMSLPDPEWDLGSEVLLKLFISWVPFEKNAKDPGFVLKHPDLDTQNILVSEEGHLCGIIDWDGVAAVPRYIGCEQYPLWLIRDWNPFLYNYNGPDPDCPQHSPEEFAYYRSIYAGFMDLCLAKEESKSNIKVQQGIASAEPCCATLSRFTRGSCLVHSLELATMHPDFKTYIVDRFFDLIEEITTSEYDKSSLGDDTQNDSRNGSDSAETVATDVGSWNCTENEKYGMAHRGEEWDVAEHQSSHEEEDSTDLSSSLSIRSAIIKSEKLNHNEEDDTLAHQSSNEEEDRNDLGSSLSIGSAMITSDKMHDDGKCVTMAHQPFKDGMDDEILPPVSSASDHRYAIAQDLSSLAFESFRCLGMLEFLLGTFSQRFRGTNVALEKDENTTRSGISTDAEATRKSNNLRGLAEPQLQPNGDGSCPSQVDVTEKFPLVNINQQDGGEFCDDVDMIAEYDQEERRAITDNDDTSTDRIQEEKGVACDTSNTSGDSVQGERVAVDDDADRLQDINKEDEMGLCGGTDTSVIVEKGDAGKFVDKADVLEVISKGYEDTGSFCLWQIVHLLHEGKLDEDRMERLKKGFLALLASLEDGTGVLPVPASVCSDAGGGSKTSVAIEDTAQDHGKSDNFPECDDASLKRKVLLEGGDARLEEASSAGGEGGVEVLR